MKPHKEKLCFAVTYRRQENPPYCLFRKVPNSENHPHVKITSDKCCGPAEVYDPGGCM